MAKRGQKGHKKAQGRNTKKVKAQQKAQVNSKAKTRKSNNKAVKTNLKKMTFDNSKKIELLNTDVAKVYKGQHKSTHQQVCSSWKVLQRKSEDNEMPDVNVVTEVLQQM